VELRDVQNGCGGCHIGTRHTSRLKNWIVARRGETRLATEVAARIRPVAPAGPRHEAAQR
jgi:hypothetical protein